METKNINEKNFTIGEFTTVLLVFLIVLVIFIGLIFLLFQALYTCECTKACVNRCMGQNYSENFVYKQENFFDEIQPLDYNIKDTDIIDINFSV